MTQALLVQSAKDTEGSSMPGYDDSAMGYSDSAAPSKDDQPKPAIEHMRLAGYMPLKTILRMSFGPVLALITNAMYSIVDTIWVSKACGAKGLAAVSAYNCFDNIGRSLGMCLSSAGATQVPYLYGKGKHDEASQLVTDLFRLALAMGIFVPLSLNWAVKPCVRWFGASEEIVDMGYYYILPILLATFVTDLHVAAGGAMQGEGRTTLYGAWSIGILIANAIILDPLFLLVFKWGLLGASMARVTSEVVGVSICLIMYYCGKFGVKPKLIQLIRKPSQYTWPALKIGFSQAIAFLSQVIPSILLRKYMGLSCHGDEQKYNDAMAGFNCWIRLLPLINSIMMAVCQGYVPAAAYAFAAKMYKRWIWLTVHSCWINCIWSTAISALTWTIPNYLAMIFSSDPGYLSMAGPMLLAGNALGIIAWLRFNAQAMLQSMTKGTLATILSLFCQFISLIGFILLLYYTDKDDVIRLNWSYSYSFAFAFVLSIIFLIKPIYDLYKEIQSGNGVDKLALVEPKPKHSDYEEIP